MVDMFTRTQHMPECARSTAKNSCFPARMRFQRIGTSVWTHAASDVRAEAVRYGRHVHSHPAHARVCTQHCKEQLLPSTNAIPTHWNECLDACCIRCSRRGSEIWSTCSLAPSTCQSVHAALQRTAASQHECDSNALERVLGSM